MDAATAVNILVSVLLMGIGLYLRRVDCELRGLREQLSKWREEMLRDCVQQRVYDRHIDDLERYKREYVSFRFHELADEINELKLARAAKR